MAEKQFDIAFGCLKCNCSGLAVESTWDTEDQAVEQLKKVQKQEDVVASCSVCGRTYCYDPIGSPPFIQRPMEEKKAKTIF